MRKRRAWILAGALATAAAILVVQATPSLGRVGSTSTLPAAETAQPDGGSEKRVASCRSRTPASSSSSTPRMGTAAFRPSSTPTRGSRCRSSTRTARRSSPRPPAAGWPSRAGRSCSSRAPSRRLPSFRSPSCSSGGPRERTGSGARPSTATATSGPPVCHPQPAGRTDAGLSDRRRRAAGSRQHRCRLGAGRSPELQPDHRLPGARRAAQDGDPCPAEDRPRCDDAAHGTSLAVPPGFLKPGTEYEWEVLAIERSGNQTLSSDVFTTAG